MDNLELYGSIYDLTPETGFEIDSGLTPFTYEIEASES